MNLHISLSVSTCVDVLVSQYIEGLKSPQMLTRCGSALALGCLPQFMIHNKLKQVGLKCVYIFNPFDNSLSQCLGLNWWCICVYLLDPPRPPADVRCQPERREFYRGKERCSHSHFSVSVYGHLKFPILTFNVYLMIQTLCLKGPSALLFVSPVCLSIMLK